MKWMKINVFYLRVISACDQCDSPFCALQLTALIIPNWCVLLYCCSCLHHILIVAQPSWTTVPCPTTKLSLLISKSFAGIKQSVISVALKTPLKNKIGNLFLPNFTYSSVRWLYWFHIKLSPPHFTIKLRPWPCLLKKLPEQLGLHLYAFSTHPDELVLEHPP